MKILCLLLLAACATFALATETCYSKSKGNLKQFNKKKMEVKIPCKYYALKQQECGPYLFTVSPGNVWLGKAYYLNTVWLGIIHKETKVEWHLRTNNKIALKFLKTHGEENLFNLKKNSTALGNTFKYGKTKDGGYITDENEKIFKLTVNPWDYDNRKKFPHSNFVFECFVNAHLNVYPEQMCGGKKKTTSVKERAKKFNLTGNHEHVIVYHDILNSTVEQMDERCIEAHAIFKNNTDVTTRIDVLKECTPILRDRRAVQCVTYFSCHPMDAFNACLRWGFDGFDKNSDHCEELGDYIDLCPLIKSSGNVTTIMREARCNRKLYKDYMSR